MLGNWIDQWSDARGRWKTFFGDSDQGDCPASVSTYTLFCLCSEFLLEIQNTTVRIVLNAQWLCPFQQLLQNLHWLPVNFLIKYEIATLTYNGCHLKSTAISHSSARSLYSRSQDKHLLLEPAISTIIGSWGFSHAAPSVWNKLPVENRNSQ